MEDNYDELYAIEELSCAAFHEMVIISIRDGITDESQGQVELVRAIQDDWLDKYARSPEGHGDAAMLEDRA